MAADGECSVGIFLRYHRPATVESSTFDTKAWVDELERRIRRRGRRSTRRTDELARQALRKSAEEAEDVVMHGARTGKSWTQGPLSREEVEGQFPNGFWPSRRFGVLQKGSIRPCDDCRESELNAAAETFESISSDGAEFPAEVAARISHCPIFCFLRTKMSKISLGMGESE